jgi:hypothetical protein
VGVKRDHLLLRRAWHHRVDVVVVNSFTDIHVLL